MSLPGLAPVARAQTWQDITANTGSVTLGIKRGAIASKGSRLYAIGGLTGRGVLVSEDAGNSFTAVNTVASAGYSLTDTNSFHTLDFPSIAFSRKRPLRFRPLPRSTSPRTSARRWPTVIDGDRR